MSNTMMGAFRANNSSHNILVCTASNANMSWSGNTAVGQTTQSQPSLACWKGQWWIVFVANDSSNRLLCIQSGDGVNWSKNLDIGQSAAAGSTPALATTNGTLFAAFVANEADRKLLICSLVPNQLLTPWPWGQHNCSVGQSCAGSPSMVAWNGMLWLAFVLNDGSNRIVVCYSPDGAKWSGYTAVGPTSTQSPSLAVYNGQLWLAYQINNGTGGIYVCSSADGTNWSSPVSAGQSCQGSPSLVALDTKLWLGFTANNGSNTLLYITSADGHNWTANASWNQSAAGGTGPMLASWGNPVTALGATPPQFPAVSDTLDALQFDGGQLNLPTIAGTHLGLRLTFWAQRTGTRSTQVIAHMGIGNGNHFDVVTNQNGDLILNLQQSGSSSLNAPSVLPANRWVLVTVTVPVSGTSTLAVFGSTVASGNIGPSPIGSFQKAIIGNDTFGNTFQGQLSQLTIEQCSDTTPWAVWASYPLTETSAASGGTTYTVADTSGNGNNATVKSTLIVASGAAPLNRALQGSALSSVQVTGLSAGWNQVSLEAWVCPGKNPKQAVLTLGNGGTSLCLQNNLPGGNPGLALVLYVGSTAFTLCSAAAVPTGIWTHVAATLDASSANTLNVVLYVQGQQAGSSSYTTLTPTFQCAATSAFLGQAMIPIVQLGGQGACSQPLCGSGQIAEARIWNIARAAADIAAFYQQRAVGNEAGLVACYHLEDAPQGIVRDASAQRGYGQTGSWSGLSAAPCLPLAHTSSVATVTLTMMGKLVTEYITEAGSSGPVNTQYTVFDATLQPQTPDGSSLGGQNLYVCPDANVTVFLDQGDVAVQTQWTGGQTYTIAVPVWKNIRLRFLPNTFDTTSTSLSMTTNPSNPLAPPTITTTTTTITHTDPMFPALRVRVDGMPSGLWALVRPDEGALQSLGNLNQGDITQPASGKSPPLPTGMSSSDVSALIGAVNSIGVIVPPASQSYGSGSVPGASSGSSFGQARSLLGDATTVWHGITSTANTVAGAAGSLVSSVGNELKTAGSWCGSLASACVDDGTVALNQVVGAVKTAGNLIVSDVSSLQDLINAASQATARVGSSAISDAIRSADTLAVGTDGLLTNAVSIIGTTVVSGTTVVWRVICAGIKDAITAVKAFCVRLAVDIKQLLAYLAWLFKWNDFLAASDTLYSVLSNELASAENYVSKVGSMVSSFVSSLNIPMPAALTQQSIAQFLGVPVRPQAPVVKELNYVVEQIQRVMSSSQLSLSSLAAAVTPSSTASWLTSSALQSAADQVNASFPMASINPVSLLTTPIGQLLGGGSSAQSSMTALLNGMVANLTSDISNVLSQSQQAITARLYVPGLTSLIENTILGGTRTLNLLRIISLCGAIPQVLFSKISSGANVPTSFADSGPPPANCAWSVCGLMIVESLISVLEGVRRAAADTNTAGDMFMLETVRLVMVIARGSLTVEMANTWTGVSQTAGVAAGGIEIASAILCLISLTGSRGPTSDWNSILKFDVGVNIAALLAMAGVTIYELVNANYQGAADWASFATQTCCWLLDAGVNSWDLYALMKGETPSELRVTSGLNIAKTTLAIGNAIAEGISNYQQSLGG